MIILFAHHLEPHHLAIALALFAVGTIGGWTGCARLLAARSRDHHTT